MVRLSSVQHFGVRSLRAGSVALVCPTVIVDSMDVPISAMPAKTQIPSCNNYQLQPQRRSLLSQPQSSSTPHDLVVELISKIQHDDDVLRARLLCSDSKSAAAQDSQRRALKDIASDFCQSYLSSEQIPTVAAKGDGDKSRERVVLHLAEECGVDHSAVEHAVSNYQSMRDMTDERQQLSMATKLREVCTPGYYRVFNHILSSARRDVGLACLIELRNDTQIYARRLERESLTDRDDAVLVYQLKEMNNNLRLLLGTLFLQPILELRRITYESTPAAIIEKVAMKEAVHPLQSLDDLRIRLGPSRRCFAFFHPSLPNEPLVFVHVALLPLIPETMEDIDNYYDDAPDVATFYSITNTQPGLNGVDLGNFLIKRVVEELQVEFPGIKTFCTLSPVPRLRKWIESKLSQEEKFFDYSLLTNDEMSTLADILQCSVESAPSALVELLKDVSWYHQKEKVDALKPILMKLSAHYLAKEKHRGRPIDGVAKFHIRNGAEMFRLNYLADKSRKGMHNNVGMMINYRYDLDTIDKNNVAYESSGVIPVKEGVSKWLGE